MRPFGPKLNLSQCRYIQEGGGGQKFNITNTNNPADYVPIVILRMIDIKFEKDPIKIEWAVAFWYFALNCPGKKLGSTSALLAAPVILANNGNYL